MSNNYSLKIKTLDSIYPSGNASTYKRNLDIHYSIPSAGTNEDTGILLIIAGFGGNTQSNIFKKMRSDFSDRYNLVTLQCDYFGSEFMQGPDKPFKVDYKILSNLRNFINENEFKSIFDENNNIIAENILNLTPKNSLEIILPYDLSQENLSYFNDMGFMQSIDNINATLSIINLLLEKEMPFNTKKIISYGFSHGAYLAYLTNAFSPMLFNLTVDNSAWLYPYYIEHQRSWKNVTKMVSLEIAFDYFAKKQTNNPDCAIFYDKSILNLQHIYSQFKNNCKIISFHGTNDTLISHTDKNKFCKSITNCVYNEINEQNINKDIFNSTSHGLGADFYKLFIHVMDDLKPTFEKDSILDFIEKVNFMTLSHIYEINYENIFPTVKTNKMI